MAKSLGACSSFFSWKLRSRGLSIQGSSFKSRLKTHKINGGLSQLSILTAQISPTQTAYWSQNRISASDSCLPELPQSQLVEKVFVCPGMKTSKNYNGWSPLARCHALTLPNQYVKYRLLHNNSVIITSQIVHFQKGQLRFI